MKMDFLENPVLTPRLETKNPHPRDAYIHFEEESHTYTIDLTPPDKPYTSVTTWIHTLFPHFDADKIIDRMMRSKRWTLSPYYGQTKEEIKKGWEKNRDEAASNGTKMHFQIECFYNLESNEQRDLIDACESFDSRDAELSIIPLEFSYFLEYEHQRLNKEIFPEYDLVPYRTEWTIFDESLFIAGSVDMIYECRRTGHLVIVDWKRSKEIKKTNGWENASIDCISHLPNSNFWHYSLQLNMYKYILEKQYEKKVVGLCVVCLHPNNGYLRYNVPILDEEIKSLIEYRKSLLK